MNKIGKHLADVEEAMTLLDQEAVMRFVDGIKSVKSLGGTVYVIGNGGSNATATHFANDLIKMCRIKAVALSDMSPVVLAYGNDNGWDSMFADPLKNMLEWNDGLVGISCSGYSENVVRAMRVAKGKGFEVLTLALTGISTDSPICEVADVVVHASVNDIRVQEDLHSIVCHAVVRQIQDDEM